jgi:hypothetical protein
MKSYFMPQNTICVLLRSLCAGMSASCQKRDYQELGAHGSIPAMDSNRLWNPTRLPHNGGGLFSCEQIRRSVKQLMPKFRTRLQWRSVYSPTESCYWVNTLNTSSFLWGRGREGRKLMRLSYCVPFSIFDLDRRIYQNFTRTLCHCRPSERRNFQFPVMSNSNIADIQNFKHYII